MVKAGVALPTLTSSSPFGEFVLLILMALGSVELSVHGPQREDTSSRGHTDLQITVAL